MMNWWIRRALYIKRWSSLEDISLIIRIERILNLVDIASMTEKFFSWLPFAAPVFTQNVLVYQMREVRLVLK